MSTPKSKVLVLSYFFEPSNFVGSHRIEAWAHYFHEFGYYPIVLTRNWNDGQSDLLIDPEKNEFSVTKHDNFEVHRIPLRIKLRDKIASQPKLQALRKFLTLSESLFSRFNVRRHTFGAMYDHACAVIAENPDIKIVIASGSPFQQYHIGYLLKKKFPHLLWIPDYRDEWTTAPNLPSSILHKIVWSLDRRSEKRWTSNATAFVSVSQNLDTEIGNFIKKPGIIVKNGFEKGDFEKVLNSPKKRDKDVLVITYIGTLYAHQDLTVICEAIQNFGKNSIRLEFIGTEIDPIEQQRLKDLQLKYPFVQLIARKSKVELYDHLQNTDISLLIPYENIKNDIPVKLFDYYLLKKCMLFVPSDDGIIADFIQTHQCGYLVKTVEECGAILTQSFEKKKNNQDLISYEIDAEGAYSRKFQTELLCQAFTRLLTEKT